ncbi:glycosyltransferase [Niveispirillum sp. KHB5.9]|uniref:glycosyltransferase n=1 Tax=Niveispirillum sp. KHB5.9 TaxID=3400269 RepID=UPI003A8B96D9
MSAIAKQTLVTDLRSQARRVSAAQDWTAAGALWTQVLDHQPLDFEALFRLGQAGFFLGELENAAVQLATALNLNATHAECLRLFARIAHRLRDWGVAEQRWARLLAVAAGDFEGHFRRAQALQRLGFYEEAAPEIDAALAQRPDNAELVRLKAENLEKVRQPEVAVDWWQKVLAITPGDLDGWLCLTRLHTHLGDHAAVETAIERVVALLSNSSAPTGEALDRVHDQLRRLGRELYANAAWVGAEIIWRHLVAREPANGDWQYRLGLTLAALGNAVEGLAAFEAAAALLPERIDITRWADRLRRQIELDAEILGDNVPADLPSPQAPDDWQDVAEDIEDADALPDPRIMIRAAAIAAEGHESWWQAVTHWNELLAEDPQDVQAMAGKVRALRGLRHFDRAEIALRALVALAPDAPEARELVPVVTGSQGMGMTATAAAHLAANDARQILSEARRLTNAQQWERALALWDRLQIFRETMEVAYRRAQCLQQLSRLEEAEEVARHARSLGPHHVGVLTILGRILVTRRKWHEAAEVWTLVIELDPEGFEQHYRLGQSQVQMEALEEARRTLHRALFMRPGHFDCMQVYFTTMVRLNLLDEAQRELKLLSQAHPDNLGIPVSISRLLVANGNADLAAAELREVLATIPGNLDLSNALSRVLQQQERWGEMVELLSPLMAAHAQTPQVELAPVGVNLSLAYDRLDRTAEMEEACLFALRCDPGNGNAMTRLARLWRTQGKIVAALTMRERFCKAYPADGAGWEERIFLTALLEREEDARRLMVEAEQAMPHSGLNAWHIARGAEAGVMLPEATIHYELAAGRDPAFNLHAAAFFRRQGAIDKALPYALAARRHAPADPATAQHLVAIIRGLELLELDWRTLLVAPPPVPVLFPESLYALLVQRLAERPRTYEPQRRGIALVTGSLAPGGAERQLVTTIRGLVDSGHALGDITLYCISLLKRLKRDFYLPLVADLPINIVELDTAIAETDQALLSDEDLALVRHFPDDMRPAIQFWYAEFLRRRPAVVHAWQDSTCLTAVVAAALAGVPRIVLSTRSTRPDNPRRRLKRYMEQAYLRVMGLPNLIMCNNSRAGASDYEEWLNLPTGTVEVIYNGIDFDALAAQADPAETRRLRLECGIPDDAPVIGGVFRMSEEKRPLLWIDSVAKVAAALPQAHFVVCGDGPMRDEMQLRAQEHGIADRLHLPGQVKVGSWFLMMDVLLLTSRMEGLPNVLLEGQSLGVPVVAPRVGGVPEVVEEGCTGFTVPHADADSLADRLLFILRDTDWRRQASSRAQVFAKEMFGIRTMVGRTLAAYFPDDAELKPRAPAAPEELRGQALAAEAGKDWEKAANIWSALSERLPDDTQAAERQALIAMRLQRFDAAEPLLRRALALLPDRPELRRQWARCLGKHGRPTIAGWQALLALLPQDFEGHLCLAQAFAEAGDDAQAARSARQALRARPGHPEPVRVLARLVHRANAGASVLHHWDGLLSLTPQDFEALMRSGVACLEQGRHAEGEQRLLRAINLHDADPRAVEPLARHLLFQGNEKHARQAILFCLRRRTRDPEAWRLLSDMLLIINRPIVMDRVLRRLDRHLSGTPADRLLLCRIRLAAERTVDVATIAGNAGDAADRAGLLGLRLDMALRAGDAGGAAALAERPGFDLLPPASQRAVRDCRTFLAGLPAPQMPTTMVDGFLAALPQALAAAPYQPADNAILHLVNSLAPGGTERQAALTAIAQVAAGSADMVTLVRTDRGTGGRAVHFAPLLAAGGVQTASLAELVTASPTQAGPVLLSQIPGAVAGHLGIAQIRDLWRLIDHRRPRVIHAWTPAIAVHAAIAGLLAGTPRIVLRAGSVAPGHRTTLMPGEAAQFDRLRRLYRFIACQPSVVLANNCQANLDSYLAWMELSASDLGNPPVIIHNAVAADRLATVDAAETARLRQALGIPQGAPLVGSVLRLEKEKGLDLWLDAAASLLTRMPDAHFLLVGDGRMRTDILRRARRLGLLHRLHLAGTVDHELGRHYQAMDALLLTSQFEGLPNALIEAQYCGVPVVARAVGGVGEAMVDQVTGLMVAGDDPDAYAAALHRLLADRQMRDGFAAAARAHATSHFSTARMLADTELAYGMAPAGGV